MTTSAQVVQTADEVVAANPNPPMHAGQVMNEVVFANTVFAHIAGVLMEVIGGSTFAVLTWDGKKVDGTIVG